MSSYIIGDIHGCQKTTRALIEKVIKPDENDLVIFVGDYIDRGPDSKGVVEYVMELTQKAPFKVIPLRGNHEQMLLDAVHDIQKFKLWMFNHGDVTLASYGIKPNRNDPALIFDEFPADHLNFIADMPLFYEGSDFFVVHAGFNFSAPDFLIDKQAMLWTRDMKVDQDKTNNRPVIHGHTPIDIYEIQNKVSGKAISLNIDNGCKFKEMPGYGHLVAYNPENRKIYTQPNID